MKVNQLYKVNSTKVIINNARQFFNDDVTLDNEKLNRQWADKPIGELLTDVTKKLPPSRSRQDDAMDVLREIFITKVTK